MKCTGTKNDNKETIETMLTVLIKITVKQPKKLRHRIWTNDLKGFR